MLRLYVSPVEEICIIFENSNENLKCDIQYADYVIQLYHQKLFYTSSMKWWYVSRETVVLSRWGVLQDNLILSTEVIM